MSARIKIHVQPRASRSEVVGIHGDSIKIRLKSPPVDGAANEELVRFLAGKTGARHSDIEITSGRSSRRKTVVISSLGIDEVRRALLSITN